MATIMDSNEIANGIKNKLGREIGQLQRKPCLAVILIGDNPSSRIYVSKKKSACEQIGIISKCYHLPSKVEEEEVIDIIKHLNEDKSINGILVQLPLPDHIDEDTIIQTINPTKDVDGFHPINIGKLSLGKAGFIPCTPKGIMRLLEEYNINVEGKDTVIIGRSNVVGKPMNVLLTQKMLQ